MRGIRRLFLAGLFLAMVVTAGSPRLAVAQQIDDGSDQLLVEAIQSLNNEFELLSLLSGPLEPEAREALSEELLAVDTRGAEILILLNAIEPVAPHVAGPLGEMPVRADVERADRPIPTPPADLFEHAIESLEGRLLGLEELPVQAASVPETSPQGARNLTLLLVSVAAGAVGIGGAWSIRQRDRDRDNLMHLAMTDGLTSLANRRRLDLDLDHHAVFDSPLTVAMIDIDWFKRLNDRQGHLFGDTVIRDVARAIENNVRREDVVYRFGGEEFCILLPGATQQEAFAIVDRVRQVISEIRYPDHNESVTVSAGISVGPGHLARSSLQAADDALLRAKGNGRDQVVASLELART